jgi:hypothetical protein
MLKLLEFLNVVWLSRRNWAITHWFGSVAMGMALHIVALGIFIGSVVMGMSLHDMTLINMNMFKCCINSCLVG